MTNNRDMPEESDAIMHRAIDLACDWPLEDESDAYAFQIDLSKEALRLDPLNLDAALLLFESSDLAHDYTSLLPALDAIIEVGHDLGENLSFRANWYLRELGDPEKALVDLNHIAQLNPNDAAIYRERAVVHLTLGNGCAARRDLELYLESNPRNLDYNPFNAVSIPDDLDYGYEFAVRAFGTGPQPAELCRFPNNYEGLLAARKMAHKLASGNRPKALVDSTTYTDAPIFAVSVCGDGVSDSLMIEWYFSHEHRSDQPRVDESLATDVSHRGGPCKTPSCSPWCAGDSSTPLGAWKVSGVQDWFERYGDLAIQKLRERSRPTGGGSLGDCCGPDDEESTTNPQLDTNEYDFRLVSTSQPRVDHIWPMKLGWQYFKLVLKMEWEVRCRGQVVLNTSQVPLVFNGQLFVTVRWESFTNPQIVTLGTKGRWFQPATLPAAGELKMNWPELGNQATRSLRDTYAGTNIREMLPKLTSELLPPPTAAEISGE